ncbi:MFS transporter [Bifidobacterium sp. UBA744]|mgnify:CR=1 FL=1|uniref:MFS transporter n=1 Tax=Bifidobacterium sp. UBA744 TaxID=1946112 RepID=UPI0025BA5791|nr:MFS transporter [Bifidobacterium sp. UBA744]
MSNATATAAAVDPDTLSPEDGKPFTQARTARYLIAFVLYAILNCAAFVLNGNTLMPQHLKDVGYSEEAATAAFGTITSLTAIVGLLSGYVWGAFSDRTRSRFGKRTPWIFAGSIVAGIGLYLLGTFGNVPSLTASYMLNNLGQGAIQTPMFAILADRVPKNVRGTLSAGLGATALGTPVGQFLSSLFLGKPYQNMGFVVGAVMIAASGIIPLLIMPKEPSSKNDAAEGTRVVDVLKNLLPPKFAGAHDFYKACAGRLLMMACYTMVSQYTLYIFENYVGMNVTEAGTAMATLSGVTFVVSLIGLAISGPLSDRIKMRKVPIFVAAVLMIIGTLCPIFFRSVGGVLAYAAFAGLGYGVYIAVDGALNVDVIPAEAQKNRDGGKYIGFGNLANTCGQVLAPALTSFLVIVSGSYVSAFVVSALFAVAGVIFIMSIKHVK